MANDIKFYTDEHIAKVLVQALRMHGIDVLTCQEAKTLGFTDLEHLEIATKLGRTIITQDTDFINLNAQGIHHSGIVFSKQTIPIKEVIRGILLVFQVMEASEMVDSIEYI